MSDPRDLSEDYGYDDDEANDVYYDEQGASDFYDDLSDWRNDD